MKAKTSVIVAILMGIMCISTLFILPLNCKSQVNIDSLSSKSSNTFQGIELIPYETYNFDGKTFYVQDFVDYEKECYKDSIEVISGSGKNWDCFGDEFSTKYFVENGFGNSIYVEVLHGEKSPFCFECPKKWIHPTIPTYMGFKEFMEKKYSK